MNASQIKKAWESQKNPPCRWAELTAEEQLEFALKHIENTARRALYDLGVAVYDPDNSAMSVAHAIGHVQQIFSTQTHKEPAIERETQPHWYDNFRVLVNKIGL